MNQEQKHDLELLAAKIRLDVLKCFSIEDMDIWEGLFLL